MPLLMTHGYPGTLWEMLPAVPALVDATAHGGAATDSFHVIVPSLPGFGFSGEPLEGSTPERAVDLWIALMDKLGYRRFGAYGSDWGAGITTQLGTRFPDRLIGTASIIVSHRDRRRTPVVMRGVRGSRLPSIGHASRPPKATPSWRRSWSPG